MPRAQANQNAAYDADWGHVKVKKVDPARWIPHVHQVLFWCGTAEQGKAARIRWQKRLEKGQAAI